MPRYVAATASEGMDCDGDERPRQSPGENEAEVCPSGRIRRMTVIQRRAFVAEIREAEIKNPYDGAKWYDVGQKFYFVPLASGDQAVGVKIVSGAVFLNRWSSSKASDVSFARGDNGLAECQIDAVELPRDHDAGEKVYGNHADGL